MAMGNGGGPPFGKGGEIEAYGALTAGVRSYRDGDGLVNIPPHKFSRQMQHCMRMLWQKLEARRTSIDNR